MREHKTALGVGIVSLGYLVGGMAWSRTGAGFPFGPDGDPLGEHQSPLASVDHATAAPFVVGLALLGIAAAWGLGRTHRGPVAHLVTGAALFQGVLYAVVLPDGRPLVAAAHVPVLVVGLPFGFPPDVTVRSQLPWPVVHQMLMMALGVVWLVAALRHARLSRDACLGCGRADQDPGWTRPEAAARWGRWCVWIAIAAPASYASSRIAWALDLPYGVTRDWLREMRADEPSIFIGGALIASLGMAGATLTFGLVARWGEVWPRWVPWLHGREVRPMVAVVPALAVAVLLLSAGKGWLITASRGYLPEPVLGENWATVIFGATLPPWGIALAGAGYAYWLRRRGMCRGCGRGARPIPAYGGDAAPSPDHEGAATYC
jgi:hypothetical protein